VEFLLEPFRQSIDQRALVELLILGAVCGPLGAWVILYRQSYAAESISHGMLPGLVLAALAGLPLILGAAGGVLVAAGLIALAARDERVGADTAVAVVITTLFGAGALLALAPQTPARLGELLFGDPLGVTSFDIAVAAALAVAVGIGLALGHRSLGLVGFDRQSAAALGTRPSVVELGLLLLLAVTVTAAVQALGNLLVVALIIAPAAAALRLSGRVGIALALAAALACLAGVFGLYASYYLGIAAGASVALAAITIFALSLPAERLRAAGR
jgi:ABC-type Mn2+/Zn2+ transport system permease subunit